MLERTIVDLPNSGNHEQDESGGGNHPCNITGIVIEVEILGQGITTGGSGPIVGDQGNVIAAVRHGVILIMSRFQLTSRMNDVSNSVSRVLNGKSENARAAGGLLKEGVSRVEVEMEMESGGAKENTKGV